MSKKMVSLFLVLLMVFSATASLAEGSEIVVTDMLGREVTLSEPATRIVVMQPSDCEILCAIGCEEAIVGRGQYVDYPASILEVPVVQSGAGGVAGARRSARDEQRQQECNQNALPVVGLKGGHAFLF